MTINHIFVYGTLRKGQSAANFGLVDHVGTFEFKGAQLFNLGWFPGIKLVDDDQSVTSSGHERPSVVGDLFKLDPKCLPRLDSYEGYREEDPERSLYLRKVITVNGQEAYVYEYNSPIDPAKRIGSGDWMARTGTNAGA